MHSYTVVIQLHNLDLDSLLVVDSAVVIHILVMLTHKLAKVGHNLVVHKLAVVGHSLVVAIHKVDHNLVVVVQGIVAVVTIHILNKQVDHHRSTAVVVDMNFKKHHQLVSKLLSNEVHQPSYHDEQ